MIHDLKPYPAYKGSGVPWLEKVPEHWKVHRLKTALIRNDSGCWGSDFSSTGPFILRSNEQTIDGGWRIKEPARRFLTSKEYIESRLETGDLVITKSSGSEKHIGKTSLVTPDIEKMNCCFSNFMQRIRLNNQVKPKLAWYWLNNTVGREQLVYGSSTTTGLSNLNGTLIENLWFSFPSALEQSAIVLYLDYMDRRIRRYIRAKQKLIKLLEEQKQAIIHQAVTRGLDPNVKLKPSGVEWLGDVPEHWEVVALRRVTLARCDGPFGSGLKSSHYTENGIRVVRLTNIGHAEFRNSDAAFISPIHYASLGDHSVKAGDVLIAGLGDERHPAGRACVAPAEILPAMVKADCFRFRIKESKINPKFAALQLTATAVTASAILSTGATRQRTNLQSTAGRLITIPPLLEQETIIDYISKNTSTLNIAIDHAHREISLLREYRTRLISDIVTGKLDVREAAANLPEETGETEVLEEEISEDEETTEGDLESEPEEE